MRKIERLRRAMGEGAPKPGTRLIGASCLLAVTLQACAAQWGSPERARDEWAAGQGERDAQKEQAAEPAEPKAASPSGKVKSRRIRADVGAPLLDGLGEHHFPVSTEVRLAQVYFDQGLIMHYGFNHAEAVRSFRQAAELDPDCAMCFAGVALSLGPNYNGAMEEADAEPAHTAAQKAVALSKDVSERERAYIEAIAQRYPEPSMDQRKEWDGQYAEAMGEVAETYPEDIDAAALHAESLMVLHPWDLWTKANEPKPWTPEILEVLESALERDPDHPFANHLYIHAQEAGPRPEAALESAQRLEDLVPGAGHLVHMPSHVYIRTGKYHEASQANERAIEADEEYLEQVQASGAYPLAYYPHNYHFLWATTMLEGRSERSLEAARAVAERANEEMMRKPGFGTLQHYKSIPYYALVAFGRYQDILELEQPAQDLFYPRTVWHYARGMARAAQGDVSEALQELRFVRRAADDERLEEVTIWDINSTRSLMQIAEALLRSEIDAARGNGYGAVAHAAKAVELEDELNYDEPPPWGPATRRYYGAALLAIGQPKKAAEAYREDLEEFPDNGWSLYGLLQSLRALGEFEEARAVEKRFEKAWRHADVVLTRSRL